MSVVVTITDSNGKHIREFVEPPREESEEEDPATLQRILDMAHSKYGKPGEVLQIPDRLPEPKLHPVQPKGRR